MMRGHTEIALTLLERITLIGSDAELNRLTELSIVDPMTFAATLALLLFAGEVIRPFAWVMAFGIVTGTFSSIYVAAPVLLWIERKWPRKTGARQSSSIATPTSRTQRSPATATR